MFVHHMWAYPQKSEEDTGSPRTGVLDGCELPSGCWEPDLGPQKEQQVLLTAAPPFQLHDG